MRGDFRNQDRVGRGRAPPRSGRRKTTACRSRWCGREVDTLCLTALAQDPAQRYSSMVVFRDCLARYLSTLEVVPAQRKQTRRATSHRTSRASVVPAARAKARPLPGGVPDVRVAEAPSRPTPPTPSLPTDAVNLDSSSHTANAYLETLSELSMTTEHHSALFGRKWLHAALSEWHMSTNDPLYMLVGDPGVGKSAVIVALLRSLMSRVQMAMQPHGDQACGTTLNSEVSSLFDSNSALVPAFHFCMWGSPTTRPDSLVHSLRIQYGHYLSSYRPSFTDVTDSRIEFMRTLHDIDRAARRDHKQCVLFIDALDEALSDESAKEGRSIPHLLAAATKQPLTALRFVATSRNDSRVLSLFAGSYIRVLRADSPENKADVSCFIRTRLSEQPLSTISASTGVAFDYLCDLLSKKADGNFLWIRWVLNELEAERYTFAHIESLPGKLRELYADLFGRYFANATTYAPAKRLLEVVAAAFTPLSGSLLQSALAMGNAEFTALCAMLAPILPERHGHAGRIYQFYHQSVADWLLGTNAPGNTDTSDVVSYGHEYILEPQNGHILLADFCKKSLDNIPKVLGRQPRPRRNPDFERYAHRFGVRHLTIAHRFADAVSIQATLLNTTPYPANVNGSELRVIARDLCAAIDDCDDTQAPLIVPDDLLTVMRSFYELDPLLPALRLVRRHHSNKWPEVQDTLLASESFYARYALAVTLADHCVGSTSHSLLLECEAMLNHQNLNMHEVGSSAAKMVYGRHPEWIHRSVFQRLATSSWYFDRLNATEMLLTLSLREHSTPGTCLDDLLTLVPNGSTFWDRDWDVRMVDLYGLQGVLAAMGKLPCLHLSQEVTHAIDSFEKSERMLSLLAGNQKITSEPAFCEIIERYFSLGVDCAPVLHAGDGFMRVPKAIDPFIELLTTHPIWIVGEAMGLLLGSLTRPTVATTASARMNTFIIERVRRLLDADATTFQARQCGITAAFACELVDSSLPAYAIRRFSRHPNPLVRGLCAEHLISSLMHKAANEAESVVEDYREQLLYWAADTDLWILEQIRLLLRHFKGAIPCLGNALNNRSELFRGHGDWFRLERGVFLELAEERKISLFKRSMN